MNFNNEAWDEATRMALEQIAKRGVDCFGDPLRPVTRTLPYTRVLSCLAEKPMRLRQIAVRTQSRRATTKDALDGLLGTGQIWCDEERFYHLNRVEIH